MENKVFLFLPYMGVEGEGVAVEGGTGVALGTDTEVAVGGTGVALEGDTGLALEYGTKVAVGDTGVAVGTGIGGQ